MTWSIVARDEPAGQIGIAVATCAFAVGARVPFIATGVGAIATQALSRATSDGHDLSAGRVAASNPR